MTSWSGNRNLDEKMSHVKEVKGFSKMTKEEKISFLQSLYLPDQQNLHDFFKKFLIQDADSQKLLDEFSENTVTNFHLPLGVCPNLYLNGKSYTVPMVIEESSVVAACAKASKYWFKRGGFHAEVVATEKIGQVHLYWPGTQKKQEMFFNSIKEVLLKEIAPHQEKMKKRGGGVIDIEWRDLDHLDSGYRQIWVSFDTVDAMGANFINTILECFARTFQNELEASDLFQEHEKEAQVVMAILSNFTPNCRVKVWVECPVEDLAENSLGMDGDEFAEKFYRAVKISKLDPYRATTHNKGIFNGIDSVVLATGNDFRAIEACGHTWASREGAYRGLTDCNISDGHFRFELELPLAVGTVGGLTQLHPLAKFSLELLGSPSASELMGIIASVGLAQNFAALKSLVTTGIQKGHMKMHLINILNHLGASKLEREAAKKKFDDEVISFRAVSEFIKSLRNVQ